MAGPNSISLFRSEPMKYVRLVMSEESAPETVRHLGHLAAFHIIDESKPDSAHFKKYKLRMQDCVAWEKRLETFRAVMMENQVELPKPDIEEDASWQPQGADPLEALQRFLEPSEDGLAVHLAFKKQHKRRIHESAEHVYVLRACRPAIQQRQGEPRAAVYHEDLDSYGSFSDREDSKSDMEASLLEKGSEEFSNRISGIVPLQKKDAFARMLFRMTKGIPITSFTPIEEEVIDPETGVEMKKVVFTVIYLSKALHLRIKKICNFMGATVYEVPDSLDALDAQIQSLNSSLKDYDVVLGRTNATINDMLMSVAWGPIGPTARVSPLVNWETVVRREKIICDTLRKCQTLNSSSSQLSRIVARGWVPAARADELRRTLEHASSGSQSDQVALTIDRPPDGLAPPSFFATSKYTAPYQNIVNTYGVPRYGEVNPALFTVITFPFLFGVMYGDIFHASALTLFAFYCIWKENKFLHDKKMGNLGELFGMAFGGRYMLLPMGLFGLFCGTIYNDCASVPVATFPSRWTFNETTGRANQWAQGIAPYPWGVDPAWYHTDNQLVFFNSLKMKMSVTFGVVQMSFGVILGAVNNMHFGHKLELLVEFLPRLLFLLCTFGYMVAIILIKATMDWSENQPPSLVQTMINMFLSPTTDDEDLKDPLLFHGQALTQFFLVLTAVVCVPTMLFAGPCLRKRAYLAKKAALAHRVVAAGEDAPLNVSSDHEEGGGAGGHGDGHGDGHGGGHGGPEYQFSEDMITTGIHTIEYVLGAVSNTASYLRLWALSLAHSELAAVFWDKMLMEYGVSLSLSQHNFIFAFVGVAVWSAATLGVLLMMDVLECFLHALRLHWVEFQNKFFHGDGYDYKPFSFQMLGASI